ncbi:MAG: hypothetical protein GX817_00490 [Elusimicrobia bacterium]|nr:hypothetical protein [Elusimicrobiota bacterium]
MLNERELRKQAMLDANINRVGEGLRVIEDWARFYLRDSSLMESVRELRHGLWGLVKEEYPQIIKGRSTGKDLLADALEGGRSSEEDIPRASFNRVKEGLRVLEESGKIISPEAGMNFKRMRFRIYDIEKDFYEKFTD